MLALTPTPAYTKNVIGIQVVEHYFFHYLPKKVGGLLSTVEATKQPLLPRHYMTTIVATLMHLYCDIIVTLENQDWGGDL